VTDPAAFLRARLDEDERLATLARPEFFTPECLAVFASAGDAAHVICHDPARVLREVEAGRAILTRYEFASRQAEVNVDAERDAWEKIAGALESDVLSLAAVWRDHPDYDPAWIMPASG
jgi:Family of unknown function (DUF6221)